MDRRPILLSSVMLRQNPHNVHEWHKRVKLFEGDPMKQIITFTEAVKTVDVDKVCSLGTLNAVLSPSSSRPSTWTRFSLRTLHLTRKP